MKIENHWLLENEKIVIEKTNYHQTQNKIEPRYLVIHYTAGDTAESAVNWFKNNAKKICAHIVIDIDGRIIQMAPFNRKCNHAGSSWWDGKERLNDHSIGIEIVNAGFCEKLEDGSFRRKLSDKKYKYYPASYEGDRIVKLKHKHKDCKPEYWFKYTPEQIEAVSKLSKIIVQTYGLDPTSVLGHDDISSLRKVDPGPAFPWDEFKQNIFEKNNDIGNVFLVQSPKDRFAMFRREPVIAKNTEIKRLDNGYEVGLIKNEGKWSKVYLVNHKEEVVKNSKSIKNEGWVYSSLLVKK